VDDHVTHDGFEPLASHRFVAVFSSPTRGRAPAFVARLDGGYAQISLPVGRIRGVRKKPVRRFTRVRLRRPLVAEPGLSAWWEDGRPLDALVVLLRGDRAAAAWRLTGLRPTRLATSALGGAEDGPVVESLEARCETFARVAVEAVPGPSLKAALAAAGVETREEAKNG
jgi:hypothetical protein